MGLAPHGYAALSALTAAASAPGLSRVPVHPQLLKDAGSEETCTQIGYRLLALGDVGRALWLEFCEAAAENSAHPDPEWPSKWWEAHAQSIPPRSGWTGVLHMAQERGWVNPGSVTGSVASAAEFEWVEVGEGAKASAVGEVPSAKYLCTDLANANRLRTAYGQRLISVGGAVLRLDRNALGS